MGTYLVRLLYDNLPCMYIIYKENREKKMKMYKIKLKLTFCVVSVYKSVLAQGFLNIYVDAEQQTYLCATVYNISLEIIAERFCTYIQI